jgi:hypothetical protein
MKNNTITLHKLSVAAGIGAIVLLMFLTVFAVIQAATDTITVCVHHNGSMRLLGTNSDCQHGETKLSWNIQGPTGPQGEKGDEGEQGEPGPKGDQGDPGSPAKQGAGNIAFIHQDFLLKTDGTVWRAFLGNVPYTRITGEGDGVGNVPVPVNNIVSWQYSNLIDKDGNYWFINLGNVRSGWQNFGPIP